MTRIGAKIANVQSQEILKTVIAKEGLMYDRASSWNLSIFLNIHEMETLQMIEWAP